MDQHEQAPAGRFRHSPARRENSRARSLCILWGDKQGRRRDRVAGNMVRRLRLCRRRIATYSCPLPSASVGRTSSYIAARPPPADPARPAPNALPARSAEGRVQGVRRHKHLRARPAALELQGLRRRQRLRARQAALAVQGLRWRKYLRARKAALAMQGVRRGEHLRARQAALVVQGLRWHRNLPARQAAIGVQGVRWRRDLRAQQAALPVQGLRRRGHLQARQAAFEVQGVRRQGLRPRREEEEKSRCGSCTAWCACRARRCLHRDTPCRRRAACHAGGAGGAAHLWHDRWHG